MTFLGNLVLLVSLPLVSGLCSKCREGQCYDTGECIAGCIQGYVDLYCDEPCPTRCVNNDCYIDRIKGTVTCTDGCEQGYCGTKCTYPCPGGCETCDRQCGSCNVTLCPERRYGADCSQICNPRYEKCDRETGQCIRCRRGYFGDECTMECKACFHTDDNLSDDCLSGCDKCRTEDACLTDFHGPSCELRCSPGCHDKGGCNKQTGECFTGCLSGYHGLACSYTCSEHCVSGRCNRATGECSSGCVSGYHGLACNYTCSEHCVSGRCNRATGECSSGCVSGYHGLTCNSTCSEHCVSGRCNRATGECSAGCVSGYQGLTCQSASEKDSENSMVPVTVILAVILFMVLVFIIVVLIGCRNRLFLRLRNYSPETCELEERLMPDETSRNRISVLRKRTRKKIDSLTSGMIRVSAVDKVVHMLQSGRNWVTITGNAGDGKTTLGYLVLKQLREKKIRVYNIEEPSEYRLLLRSNKKRRVILFDDRFGAFTSDQVLVDKWKRLMNYIHKEPALNENQIQVIFISRKNVINQAKDYLGDFQDIILDPENVVDLSLMKVQNERLKILDYYLKQGNLKIRTEVKQRVADLDIAHGFPHCSMMYPKLKAKKHDLDIEEFFKTPLKFLDVTTSVLYNENCKDLFEHMIKDDGLLDVYSVEDDTRRTSLLRVVREQEGSYITVRENGLCVFAHPSIYESVLSVICETNPLFCMKYASLSVIRQKLILTSDVKQKSPTQINVIPQPEVLKTLVERLQPDFLQGDYSVFKHSLCDNESFCMELLGGHNNVTAIEQCGTKRSINQPGKEGTTMLWTALKSGHLTAVQTLVKAGADVTLQDERGRTPLNYLCELKYSTDDDDDNQQCVVMNTIRLVITEGRGDVNFQDERGRTALHYLAMVQNSAVPDENKYSEVMEIIRVIITERRGDVNIHDQSGHTPLHYLLKCRAMTREEIKWIITEGKGDLGKCEHNMSTPLHYLCAYSGLQLDTVDRVITEGNGDFNKGDEHGTTPLHYVCHNTNIGCDVILQIVNTANGDINKQDNNGITPLHVLGRRRGVNADVFQQLLRQIPEADKKGKTPSDYITETDDTLPWNDGVINRSASDLVLCRLEREDKWIAVLGPSLSLSSVRVHQSVQVEDFGQQLTNMRRSGQKKGSGQFSWFEGTCSGPLPPSPSTTPAYWETNSQLKTKEALTILLQFGVIEGRDAGYKGQCISQLPQSICVSVTGYCPKHSGRICIQVIKTDQENTIHQCGECVPLPPPTLGGLINLTFGVVLDVGKDKGRLAFIDLERGQVLCKVHINFKEVLPMFHVFPSKDKCEVIMKVVSGREISVNEKKIQLIQQALSDKTI